MSLEASRQRVAQTALKCAVGSDVLLMSLAGYLTQKHTTIEPEAFSDALADLLNKGGMPVELGVELMLNLLNNTGLLDGLSAYLDVFEKAYLAAQTPPPVAAPQTITQTIIVGADLYAEVQALLNTPRNDSIQKVRAHRFQSEIAVPGAYLTVYVDVVGFDHHYVLDGYMLLGPRTVASAPPVESLAEPVVLKYLDTTYRVFLTP